ncbi:LEPR-XLL domain-containing protein [Tautonia marina]|uniref:LEPR-XLL domain-containing protein n=1 Tax=Tautonia marina TaxID=2653855 RepID=UPI001260D995|nr:LEPR-XLL domain-containing protein [Tautonia marina]
MKRFWNRRVTRGQDVRGARGTKAVKPAQHLRNPEEFHVEALEQRVLLNGDLPFPASQVQALRSGLDTIASWADSIDQFENLAQQLPFVGTTLGESLDIGGLLRSQIVTPAQTYLDSIDPTPNGLRDLLNSLGLGEVNQLLDDEVLTYSLAFSPSRSEVLPINLGENDFGFDPGALPSAAFETSLTLDFTFGLDLTEGLANSEAFFVVVDAFSAGGSVSAADLAFDANLGFLATTISDGEAELAASVELTLNDPDANGRITLSELVGTSLDELVDLSPAGTLAVSLPVAATIGTFNLDGTLLLNDSDLFDATPPQFSQTGLDDGLNFNQLTPESILGAVQSIREKLESLRNSSLFNSPIPLTSGTTLGSLLPLESILESELIDRITNSPTPNFATLQQLVENLVDVLAPGTGLDYNPITNELSIAFDFNHVLDTQTVPINLDLSLGSLGEFSTSSTIEVDADLDLAFTVIIDLTPFTDEYPVPDEDDPLSLGLYLLERLSLDNVSFAANLAIAAVDLAATAQFGFLGLELTEGAAAASLAASLALHKPNQPGVSRLTLNELTSGIVVNPASLGAFDINGSGSLSLPQITIADNVIPLNSSPSASFEFPDLTNLANFTPTFTNFDELLNFENVGFSTFVNAFKALTSYLDSVQSFSFLSYKLPLVDQSISELVSFVDQFDSFVTALESGPSAGTLQVLADRLETALGVAPGTIVLVLDGPDVLRFDLNLEAVSDSGPIPFNLDLDAIAGGNPLLAGITSLIDVSGSGLIQVEAGATLALHFGLDLSNPLTPAPFIEDTTGLELTARLVAEDLDFSVAIGPLGAFVVDGVAVLDADGDLATTDPAAFTVDLNSVTGGRYFLPDLDTSIVNVTLQGGAEVSLPLFFPDQGTPLGGTTNDEDSNGVPDNVLAITVSDITDLGSASVITPDIASAVTDFLGNLDLLNQLGLLIDGLDLLLGTIEDGLKSRVFNVSIPLIGTNFKDAATFISEIRSNVIQKLKDAPDQALLTVQTAIFEALGPPGLDILQLDPETGGDPNAIDPEDVPYELDSDQILFPFLFQKTSTVLSESFAFDIGLPGLGLQAAPGSTVQVELGYTFQFGVGVSKTHGFFFDTSAMNELEVELALSVPGMDLSGSLGFLTLQLKDADGSDPARPPSEVSGSFTIDLLDPSNDGRLTFTEIASAASNLGSLVDAGFEASVDINLDARVSFAGSAVFPSLLSDIDLTWSMSGNTAESSETFGGGAPDLAFNNVRLDLGSFFSDFVGPILGTIDQIIEPIRPVLEVINARLPVFSDVGPLRDLIIAAGGDSTPVDEISLLDLALAFPSEVAPQVGAIASAIEIINLIDRVASQVSTMSGSDNIFIPLGNFELGVGTDIRAAGFSLSTIDPNVVGGLADSALDYLAGLAGDSVADEARSLIEQFAGDAIGGAGNALSFPILDDPTIAFKLLLGQDVELMAFDMPRLSLDFTTEIFFPILGPLGVQLNGAVSAAVDFVFGYDTRGLRLFADSGFDDPEKIFYGFYVSDTANAFGTGPDIPEVELRASIEAFGAINVVIASAGVGGGLYAEIDGNLNDPNSDGKVHLDELIENFPLCIFDIDGRLTVGLSAFVKVGFGPFSVKKTFEIATATLLDFSYSCEEPSLYTIEGDTLILNMGPRAGDREEGAVDDDEFFTITHVSGSAGSEVITISAFGITETVNGGFSKIEGEGGAGNDNVVLNGVLTATEIWGDFRSGETAQDGNDILLVEGANVGPVTLRGGGGNDELQGGDNDDEIHGGSGDDTIQGAFGNDSLYGGAGIDRIQGGEGNDSLDGGDQEDVLIGGEGNDTIHGGAGHDEIDGGEGDDEIHGGSGNDTIFGGAGHDEIHGDDGHDEIYGEAGNDTIFGEDGDDEIHGQEGDDEIDGGLGNDTIFGEDGHDLLFGDVGNDSILGGLGNDTIQGGADTDTLRGEDGDDLIEGGTGNDLIFGGLGNDRLIGGSSDPADLPDGNDTIHGDAGNDTILGGNGIIGSITLIGGAGDDQIFGGAGNDLIYGQAGYDTIEGGTGDDTLFGNAGNDVIYGQQDNDLVEGGAGNDTILGGTGGDVLIGGSSVVVGDLIDGGLDGADSIVGDAGDDWILGDNGTINRAAGLLVTNPSGGSGNDTAFGGLGDDVIFGGGGADHLVGDAAGGTGRDLIVGDQGSRSNTQYVSLSTTGVGSFGNDTLFGSGGDDTLMGGPGDDSIFGDLGNDIIFGDQATITFVAGVIQRLFTSQPEFGGNDTIQGGAGHDTIFGGRGDDSILGGTGNDILLGDHGVVVLADGSLEEHDIFTTDPQYGGKDTIEGGDGDDTILGGTGDDDWHGIGGDSLSGGLGNDIIIADHGIIVRNESLNVLRIETTETTIGGDDVAFGDGGGRDTLFGGFGDDSLVGGSLNDIIFGDNGAVVFDDGSPEAFRVFTTAPADGGQDTIEGGSGDDILIGGTDADLISGDNDADVILGDHALIIRNATDEILRIQTIEPTDGGNDTIQGGDQPDTVFGGFGDDVIFGGEDESTDVLFGDHGVAVRSDGSADANDLFSTDPDYGGKDTIDGSGGHDILIGGSGGNDTTGVGGDLLLGGLGHDVILGDNGWITRNASNVIERIETIAPQYGGDDSAQGGDGNDSILGGYGEDSLEGNDGNDILLGDNGALEFNDDADLTTLDFITTTDPLFGHNDTIEGGNGDDIALGGTADDLIAGNDGNDILLGDHGRIDLQNNIIFLVQTIDPGLGGRDLIFGNDGDDIVLGGFEGDTLDGGLGDDVLLGDNGRLEWLSSGRLEDITGIDVAVENPALAAAFAVPDTDISTLDLITTTDPTLGGRDLIVGGNDRDVVFGGTDADLIHGDDGDGIGDPGNHDVLFGDHGRIYPQFSSLAGFNARNFFSIDTGAGDGGEGDRIVGEEGDDILIGGQGDDRLFGSDGDDDMTGGHNVIGGVDELIAPAIHAMLTPIGPVNDLMDGGAGNDVLAGDNAIIWRRGDDLSPRFRLLATATIYTTTHETITTNVGADPQRDPAGSVGRDVRLLDHDEAIETNPQGRFGSDVMAGGPDNDLMFGQLGDDLMQGDGAIAPDDGDPDTLSHALQVSDSGSNPNTAELLAFNIAEASTDGDDAMEGNGGNDLMYGGLGQDDMIGGSSSLYGLTTTTQRPDGSDTIFGGAGNRISRNDVGDPESLGPARDADVIMGDNANLFRLVAGGSNPQFLTFVYDSAFDARIIPRAVQQLDYTLGGADYQGDTWEYVNGVARSKDGSVYDQGAPDMIHGEDGNDSIFGMTGSDVLFGNAQDDDLIGGYGHDWISGGTGNDGVIGDDGLISTSRNGSAEPLYGIAATTEQTISTPGQIQYAVINPTGAIKKTVDLTPFSVDPNWIGLDDEFPDALGNGPIPFADDIIFGGLGNDSLHGGSGDDAISGAEVLSNASVPTYDDQGNPTGLLNLGYDAVTLVNLNPGNVLAFNPVDVDARQTNNRLRAGEFALYDEYDPLRKIVLNADGSLNKGEPGPVHPFLLNFEKTEGPEQPGGTTGGPKGTSYGPVKSDGDDAIFGGTGNDWLGGGTGRDNVYGGWGNDLINLDDDQDTNGGLNDQPDTHPTYEDRGYGGAGRDILIGNTGGDRLIDWVGEYNSYLVPFAPFGMATVSRTLQPQLAEFLYALSAADGADPTRASDTGADPARNGEPFGELGLVLQKDAAWRDQTGPPADPQAGNIPGGKRDVLRSADFNNGQAQGFAVDVGTWSFKGGRYEVAPSEAGGDAVSVFYVDDYIPSYFETMAVINTVKPTRGYNANAYLVFDYQSPTDFKFAGVNISTNKLEIGHRTAQGWTTLVQESVQGGLKDGADYTVFLAVNGSAVTLVVNNLFTLSHAFTPRVDETGLTYAINTGLVGLGARNARAQIDNVVVQRVPPVVTLNETLDFDAPSALLDAPLTGHWDFVEGDYIGTADGAEAALNTLTLRVGPNAMLDLSSNLRPTGAGGLAFDVYSADDYKVVSFDRSTRQLSLSHRSARGWFVDASTTVAASDTLTLGLVLKGTTASVTLNGSPILSKVYNAVITDGGFGLWSRSGSTAFETFTVKTDDSRVLGGGQNQLAVSGSSDPATAVVPLGVADLTPMLTEAIRRWSEFAPDADRLSRVPVWIQDLPGDHLAYVVDGAMLIDPTAAGQGWFLDATPHLDEEFGPTHADRPTPQGVDLLSVLMHEFGHVLGLPDLDVDQHGDDLMAELRSAGVRHTPRDASGLPTPDAVAIDLADTVSGASTSTRVALRGTSAGRPPLWIPLAESGRPGAPGAGSMVSPFASRTYQELVEDILPLRLRRRR